MATLGRKPKPKDQVRGSLTIRVLPKVRAVAELEAKKQRISTSRLIEQIVVQALYDKF